jgi:SAM-dependent methyltransferase
MNYLPNSCVCGAQDSRIIFPIADWNFSNVSESAEMHRCSKCGSLFPNRFPDEDSIALAYSTYYTIQSNRSLVIRLRRSVLDLLQGRIICRSLPKRVKHVLDFGCGSGAWLTQMKVMRPELDLAGTDLVQPNFRPLSFRWIPLDKISENRELFDWITLSHVIEHLHDPRKVLQELVACLAPGGSIWIATPNAHSYLFSSLNGRARDADFPRHRQIFSRQAMTHLLQECGLEVRVEQPPRINAVLNLSSSLAARNRPPFDIAPAIAARYPIIDTLRYLVQGYWTRLANSPELILIGRKPDTYK